MSAVLPLKESSIGLIVEVSTLLGPCLQEIAPQWRDMLRQRYGFDERTLNVLERISLSGSAHYLQKRDFPGYFENANYYGMRLSKLQVDTRAVAETLALHGELCERRLEQMLNGRAQQAAAALELLRSATFVTISGAYFDAEAKGSTTLLAVLDAELDAGDLSSILSRVLDHTLHHFGANLGMVLLKMEDSEALRVEAIAGIEGAGTSPPEEIHGENSIAGNIAQTGEPEMVLNVANNPMVRSEFIRRRANSLWGVPLKDRKGKTMGVLLIGFPKPYEWLPKERDLMRAIADRTALAIDRARTHTALRERETRIAELSAHLLRVQEEERKRISRELHDETGQALMVIRLYLGMLETSLKGKSAARNRVHETLAVVDRTIEGIRRIIARLSPLLLQELGLIAAIRKEAKDMSKTSGVKVQVTVDEEIGRLAPDVETAVYRVVQEALHNVRKHAQAKNVSVKLVTNEEGLRLQIEDDGIGFAVNSRSTKSPRANSFGLAGITERITSLGGKINVVSRKQKGTRIEITVPAGIPPGLQQNATKYETEFAGVKASH